MRSHKSARLINKNKKDGRTDKLAVRRGRLGDDGASLARFDDEPEALEMLDRLQSNGLEDASMSRPSDELARFSFVPAVLPLISGIVGQDVDVDRCTGTKVFTPRHYVDHKSREYLCDQTQSEGDVAIPSMGEISHATDIRLQLKRVFRYGLGNLESSDCHLDRKLRLKAAELWPRT